MTALCFREALQEDLSTLVEMLSDDVLGSSREDMNRPLNQRYQEAFQAILTDANNELIVVYKHDEIIGMLQLTFIPYLTHIGSWRCLVEGVRIHANHRGKGLGSEFLRWAIERAKQRKCRMIQLTSDKQRHEAIQFYENLGFKATHEGFKMPLKIQEKRK